MNKVLLFHASIIVFPRNIIDCINAQNRHRRNVIECILEHDIEYNFKAEEYFFVRKTNIERTWRHFCSFQRLLFLHIRSTNSLQQHSATADQIIFHLCPVNNITVLLFSYGIYKKMMHHLRQRRTKRHFSWRENQPYRRGTGTTIQHRVVGPRHTGTGMQRQAAPWRRSRRLALSPKRYGDWGNALSLVFKTHQAGPSLPL